VFPKISLNLDINKYKNNIVSIAIIILALLIASNIYKSQAKGERILKEKKETEVKKNEILANIGQLEKRIASYKEALGQKDLSSVMNNINNIARETGVKIISLRPLPEKDYSVYRKYSFELNLSAQDYHHIGEFMSKIENSPQIYLVEALDMRPSSVTPEQREETGGLTAVLTLSLIFFQG